MTEEEVNKVLLQWVGRPLWSIPGGIMNHFTNIDALSNIVRSGKLRLTLYSEMTNGSSEGEYVMRLYHEVLEEMETKGEIGRGLCRGIYNPPVSFRRWIQGCGFVECRPYVICFSMNDDDDVMGPRYYRRRPGGWICSYSNINEFSDHGLNPNATFDSLGLMMLQKVCYDADFVKNEIRRMVLDFIRTGHDDRRYTALCIGEVISCLRLVVKERIDDDGNDASEEREIRLIYYVPTDDSVVERLGEIMSKFDYVERNGIKDREHIEIPFFGCVFDMGQDVWIRTHSEQVVNGILSSESGLDIEWNYCGQNGLALTVSRKRVLTSDVGHSRTHDCLWL